MAEPLVALALLPASLSSVNASNACRRQRLSYLRISTVKRYHRSVCGWQIERNRHGYHCRSNDNPKHEMGYSKALGSTTTLGRRSGSLQGPSAAAAVLPRSPLLGTRRRVVHQGLVAETRAASMSAPLLDGNELRPVLHLHARHEPILAVLGLENRGFAFLHIEPVLAQGIDDVGLVRDEEGVFALFWQPACGMISN